MLVEVCEGRCIIIDKIFNVMFENKYGRFIERVFLTFLNFVRNMSLVVGITLINEGFLNRHDLFNLDSLLFASCVIFIYSQKEACKFLDSL